MTEGFPSPGSYEHFAGEHGLDPADPGTLAAFTAAAGGYRESLARDLGVTPDELHVLPNPNAFGASADTIDPPQAAGPTA